MKKLLTLLIITSFLTSGCFLFGNETEEQPVLEEEISESDDEVKENFLADIDRSCMVDDDCRSRRVNCGDCGYEFACANKEVESCAYDPSKRENCPTNIPAPWFTNCMCIDSVCMECVEEECGNPFL